MSVTKFRSLDEAARALWRAPDDPALLGHIRSLWRLGDYLAPWRLPPGVHRYPSVEAMNRQRQIWERECVVPRFKLTQGEPTDATSR